MTDKSLEFLKSKPADKDFHCSRIMFCLRNGKVEIGPENTSESHIEWFGREGWLTDENAEQFLSENIRGFFLPKENKLYAYRGVGFQFDEKVLPELSDKIEDFKKCFNLNDETEIHLGPKDSPINGREYPRRYAGRIKELMAEFRVELMGSPQNAQTMAVAAALGCFEEKSAPQILEELLALPKEERLKKEKAVLKNSFGRGHGSVGDQIHFTFSVENLPRAATLFLCLPEYLEHLQQSLRRAKASRGFYLPEAIKNSALAEKVRTSLNRTFDFYSRACAAGIPEEDARFPLSLYTKTNITTTGNARELCHISSMARQQSVPGIARAVADEMVGQASKVTPYLFEDFGFNYEILSWYPSSQLFASTNSTITRLVKSHEKNGSAAVLLNWMSSFEPTPEMLEKSVGEKDEAELSNLKHLHFEFLVAMSLTCFHQATRQRTWNHSVESIYDAAEDALLHPEERMVLPPSIKNSGFVSEYKEIHLSLLKLYKELTEQGIAKSEAVGVLPHSLKIYDWIHVNGWNAIHSIGKRTCTEAQWEIRLIARKISEEIKKAVPAFRKWAEPQCITYGKCPEIKDCGYYRKNRN